jgi:hypothetical protein
LHWHREGIANWSPSSSSSGLRVVMVFERVGVDKGAAFISA